MTDGIDVSHYQSDAQLAGDWLFIVHAVGDGLNFLDPEFARRFQSPNKALRGAYLYARPGESDGKTQANHFADVALAAGFHKDVDLWQCDCEHGENEGVTPAQWAQFISDFMWTAFARLGRRGFLYAGWPFLEANGLTDLPKTFQWWLPDYGPINDGTVHPITLTASYDAGAYVVLHQYTSHGNLDRNVVANIARWENLVPTVDWSALEHIAAFYEALPLHAGVSSWAVTALKDALNKLSIGPGNDSPVYGEELVESVAAFKVLHDDPNTDGTVFGAPAADILFKLL